MQRYVDEKRKWTSEAFEHQAVVGEVSRGRISASHRKDKSFRQVRRCAHPHSSRSRSCKTTSDHGVRLLELIPDLLVKSPGGTKAMKEGRCCNASAAKERATLWQGEMLTDLVATCIQFVFVVSQFCNKVSLRKPRTGEPNPRGNDLKIIQASSWAFPKSDGELAVRHKLFLSCSGTCVSFQPVTVALVFHVWLKKIARITISISTEVVRSSAKVDF